ncbi:hypothetical protein [Oleiagrimonas sp. MCCC 1A03011]|uniref:hypothetical protein n=1 Tax=Oleiagrimonas sp. MCCC 1A03011 TaxID=1926883 RepID=UPI0011BF244F|nr:hypothetical protein [Oleiagrimonas sp. MCCC 1A03011]
MLSRLARFLFACASLSPVAITWVIANYGHQGFDRDQLLVAFCAIMVALICYLVLKESAARLTAVSFKVVEVKAVDSEVVGYIVTYLFPFIAPEHAVSVSTLAFLVVLLAFVLSAAHAFTFNPLLTVFGYHFYEVKCSSGVSYLLLSDKDVTDVKQVDEAGKISSYLLLDLSKGRG